MWLRVFCPPHNLEGSRFGAWHRDLATLPDSAGEAKGRVEQAARANVTWPQLSLWRRIFDRPKFMLLQHRQTFPGAACLTNS